MLKHLSVPDETTALTVYYDGACPLCRKEIGWYRRQRGADNICWFDISSCVEDLVTVDLSRVEALQRFHVRKIDGTLVSGALAFAELWLCLPRFKLFGVITKLPVITQVAEQLYRLFLRLRPSLQRCVKRI